MPVCFDRNEGALPSRRTEMVGKDSGGTAGQCSTTDSRSSRHSGSMQQKKRAQQHRAALLPRLPGQSHVPGCRFSGQNRLRLGLHPGSNWRRLAAFRGKRGVCVGKRRRCRACEGQKAHFFCVQRSWLWRHLSEKQQVKDGGVCRVIWTSTRGSRRCKSSFHPSKAETSRISLRAYRKKPLFSPFICLISAISAPDNWCIGRVAILGTRSDVCVTPRTRHTVGLKGASP